MSIREGVRATPYDGTIEDAGVVGVSGELDMSATDAFLDIATVAFERHGRLTIDLSALSFIDSSGIRAIVAAAERADGLSIRGPSDPVRKVLDLTGIVGRRGIQLDV